jgi:hypothetical protein
MQSDKTIKQITYLLKLFVKQKFEDTKEIIRSVNRRQKDNIMAKRTSIFRFVVVVSNAYCVVFALFVLSCVLDVASFSGLSIFDCTCGILWRLFVIRNHKSKDR